MKQMRFISSAVGAVVFALMITLFGCSPQSDSNALQEFHIKGKTMGTTYNVKLISSQKLVEQYNLYSEISDVLALVNQQMSTYIPDSELSKFNAMQSTEPVTLSVDLQKVIEEALRLGVLSQGNLDVTVGPVVNLWGFGPDKKPEVIPTDTELNVAMSRTGLDKLYSQGNLVGKTQADLYVDLSTIAKGFGVDKVADLLESKGINNYLVEIGGEMRLKGNKSTTEAAENTTSNTALSHDFAWKIAVEKPDTLNQEVQKVIIPGDNAVATSGDYRNYIEHDGVRYSHIINPRTGYPINHKLVSVTVVHPLCMTADGLSTAIMVMGTEQGYQFAIDNNIAAYMITKTDNGFEETMTPAFVQYVAK